MLIFIYFLDKYLSNKELVKAPIAEPIGIHPWISPFAKSFYIETPNIMIILSNLNDPKYATA